MIRRGLSALRCGVFAGVALAGSMVAHADTVSLTLSNFEQTALPGSTVSFYATVTAPLSNAGIENLNGDMFSINFPAVLDDTGYQTGFPLSLNPGDTYTGLLFTVFLPANIAEPGTTYGTFTLTGGPSDNSANALASVSYFINPTPEPSSLLLLGTGAMGGVMALRRRLAQS